SKFFTWSIEDRMADRELAAKLAQRVTAIGDEPPPPPPSIPPPPVPADLPKENTENPFVPSDSSGFSIDDLVRETLEHNNNNNTITPSAKPAAPPLPVSPPPPLPSKTGAGTAPAHPPMVPLVEPARPESPVPESKQPLIRIGRGNSDASAPVPRPQTPTFDRKALPPMVPLVEPERPSSPVPVSKQPLVRLQKGGDAQTAPPLSPPASPAPPLPHSRAPPTAPPMVPLVEPERPDSSVPSGKPPVIRVERGTNLPTAPVQKQKFVMDPGDGGSELEKRLEAQRMKKSSGAPPTPNFDPIMREIERLEKHTEPTPPLPQFPPPFIPGISMPPPPPSFKPPPVPHSQDAAPSPSEATDTTPVPSESSSAPPDTDAPPPPPIPVVEAPSPVEATPTIEAPPPVVAPPPVEVPPPPALIATADEPSTLPVAPLQPVESTQPESENCAASPSNAPVQAPPLSPAPLPPKSVSTADSSPKMVVDTAPLTALDTNVNGLKPVTVSKVSPASTCGSDDSDELAAKLARRNMINEGEAAPQMITKGTGTYNEFPEFSRKQIKYFTETFKKYDEDRDNFIDFNELKRMMEKLGEPQTHVALKQIIKKVDEDQDGKVSVREFLLIFRYAAGGELGLSSEVFKQLADSVDVTKEGVHGAAEFFQAKIAEQSGVSKFEAEIRAEQEERKREEEEKKERRKKFLENKSLFH
ncbi:hypothetical protein PENTCL1PPCAC_6059, partial [Pristionchus entomophagus]